MRRVMTRRLLADQQGFTLVEMLVTMAMMLVVMSAIYSIFDSGIRVFTFGNAKVEATESARIGLEKMAREIRAAYPVNKAAGNSSLLLQPGGGLTGPTTLATGTLSTNQIAFGNDTNDNYVVDPSETIEYKLDNSCTSTTSTCTLQRLNPNSSTSQPQPVVENVQGSNGLSITYYKKDASGNLVTTTNASDVISAVQITLTVKLNCATCTNKTQTLTTEVDLRNATS